MSHCSAARERLTNFTLFSQPPLPGPESRAQFEANRVKTWLCIVATIIAASFIVDKNFTVPITTLKTESISSLAQYRQLSTSKPGIPLTCACTSSVAFGDFGSFILPSRLMDFNENMCHAVEALMNMKFLTFGPDYCDRYNDSSPARSTSCRQCVNFMTNTGWPDFSSPEGQAFTIVGNAGATMCANVQDSQTQVNASIKQTILPSTLLSQDLLEYQLKGSFAPVVSQLVQTSGSMSTLLFSLAAFGANGTSTLSDGGSNYSPDGCTCEDIGDAQTCTFTVAFDDLSANGEGMPWATGMEGNTPIPWTCQISNGASMLPAGLFNQTASQFLDLIGIPNEPSCKAWLNATIYDPSIPAGLQVNLNAILGIIEWYMPTSWPLGPGANIAFPYSYEQYFNKCNPQTCTYVETVRVSQDTGSIWLLTILCLTSINSAFLAIKGAVPTVVDYLYSIARACQQLRQRKRRTDAEEDATGKKAQVELQVAANPINTAAALPPSPAGGSAGMDWQ